MKKRLIALVLCLVMLLSMCVSFTACSNDKEEDVEGDILAKTDGAKTVTMWVVTENKKNNIDADGNYCYSPAVQQAMDEVEAAFTKITKSSYKTNVDIIFLTEEEYYGKLERAIVANTDVDELVAKAERALLFYLAEMEEKINNQEIPYKTKDELTTQFYVDYPEHWPYREGVNQGDGDAAVEEEEEYILNEWGIPELKYPDTEENQVDIIYISGQDKLTSYIENDWLASLDADLTGVGALLGDYIAPALLEGVKYNGMTYAIPNNIAIGEYTYMLIDKKLYDDFGYGSGFTSDIDLVDCEAFLKDVADNRDSLSGEYYGVTPIASSFEETLNHFVYFWELGYDMTEDDLGNVKYEYPFGNAYNNKLGFSMFGTVYGNPANATRGKIALGFNNLFADAEYQNILRTLKAYDINGYYEAPAANKKAAISYLNGDYSIKKEALENDGVYTDENGCEYYVTVVKYPQVGEDELYGNMFGICSASKHAYASVQIITAINTNPTLRNILQYGVEGDHYEINETTGMLERLPLVYVTEDEDGNEIKTETKDKYLMDIEKTGNCFVAHPEEGLPANYWENSKIQNGESVIDPLLGFDIANYLENSSGGKINKGEIDSLASANATIKGWLDSATSVEILDSLISELVVLCGKPTAGIGSAGVNIEKYTDPAFVDETGEKESPNTIYYSWMTDNGYLPLG